MRDVEASAFVVRLEQTWPTPRWPQVLSEQWKDDLLGLPEGPAGTAFARLRQSHKDRPSFAEFNQIVREIAGRDQTPKELCRHCSNSGWLSIEECPDWCKVRDFDVCGHTAATACECEAGNAPRSMQAGRLEHAARRTP